MAKAVLYHKQDSKYDDEPSLYYNFPRTYLSRIEKALGDGIIYYGPLENRKGRYYSGTGKIAKIRADEKKPNHYYADIVDYIDFDRPVDYRENGGFETKLVRTDGSINSGTSIQAVRIIDELEYEKIIRSGIDYFEDIPEGEITSNGFTDLPQKPIERPIILKIFNTKYRDRKFRYLIRKIYDNTCAFTGLRLINGGGKSEIEAAHIKPVEENGPDSVRNGLALSRTVHWMFDRGLLSLQNDYKIMVSRHLNYDISGLLFSNLIARVPSDAHMRPSPEFLGWHRENRFKK